MREGEKEKRLTSENQNDNNLSEFLIKVLIIDSQGIMKRALE